MAALLKIVDEHFGPDGRTRAPAVDLRLVSERITPREIIRRRVEAEIEIVNERKLAHALGHRRTRSYLIDIDPDSAESILKLPSGAKRGPRLDRADEETARALAAFDKHQFIMLFDDRQIDELDAELTVTPESQAVFLYLMPLKGG